MIRENIGKVFIVLFLLTSSLAIFYYLSLPVIKFDSHVSIFGNKIVQSDELRKAFLGLDLDGHRFFQINGKDLEKFLVLRPFIDKVKVRSLVFPQKEFKVYIQEEEPWAIYKGQIINKEGEVIIKSRNEAKLFQAPSVEKIYADFENKQSNLIFISSFYPLYEKDFEVLKKSDEIIAEGIKVLNLKLEDKIYLQRIFINRDKNLIFITNKFQIRVGILDDKILKRVKKFDLVLNKMQNLNEELAYIDLSMSSKEVILGKQE